MSTSNFNGYATCTYPDGTTVENAYAAGLHYGDKAVVFWANDRIPVNCSNQNGPVAVFVGTKPVEESVKMTCPPCPTPQPSPAAVSLHVHDEGSNETDADELPDHQGNASTKRHYSTGSSTAPSERVVAGAATVTLLVAPSLFA